MSLLSSIVNFAGLYPAREKLHAFRIYPGPGNDHDNTGLWDLLDLTGLLGLAGLWRRHDAPVRTSTDPRVRSQM
jgi:hypothetical protein